MFSLHSVSCKKLPTSECIQFFFLLHTATYVSYITEYEPCTWHHVAHLVFYLNLHTYIWKQTTHSVGCIFVNIYCTVPVAFEIYSAIGLISWTIYKIAVWAASTLCKPQANILKNLLKRNVVILTKFLLPIAPEGNFPCSQWWKFHQNDIFVSVLVQVESY